MRDCIRIVDLSKEYHRIEVVKSINFSVPKGCLCAFLGSNGAGKTTTMKMMITLLKKTSGKIYIEDCDLDLYCDSVRRKIGVVFQEDVLDDELTVYENLYYRGGLYYKKRSELIQVIQSVSQLLGLNSLLYHPYRTCSGGQKRLVQIGRALLPNPTLLVLDEPTIGLDPLAREQVWSILQKLNQDKKITIFYSTHYMEEACLAQQICIIHQGKLLLCQNVQQLCQLSTKELVSKRLHDMYLKLLKEHELTKD